MVGKELSKELYCLRMRDGLELWYEKEKIELIQKLLENQTSHRFIRLDERTINTADISGIFPARDIDDMEKKKRGLWKCKYNKWHGKNDQCTCGMDKLPNWSERP